MAFLDKTEFLESTGFDIETIKETNVDLALEASANKLRQVLFVKQTYEFTTPDDKFKIDVPIADYDGDGEITVDDFEIYEFDPDDYVDPDTDRKDEILSFNTKYGYIVMDALYPSNNRTLIIESYTARFENEQMQPYLKRLMVLFTSQYIFNTTPIEKLQEGISSWNLNGVNIAFDQNSINTIKEEIKKEINEIISFVKPIQSFKTNLGFANDDRTRWGFDLRTPGGNRYRRF
jgi:hypothetical protein